MFIGRLVFSQLTVRALLSLVWIIVVLGLVSTKVPELEPLEQLERKIDEAAKYLPLEQLAISPQCGFGSDVSGNLVSEDDQKRKLERVVELARKVWR